MRFELDYQFLRDSGLLLNAEDLRLGVSLGLISPPVAIAIATDAVNTGDRDPSMVGLDLLDRDDVAGVCATLRAVDPADAELFPPSSVRKFTYLQLKAAFELRDRLTDPLGVVEQVYADFDYPASVAAFVRYMPPPPDADVGEQALYERWAQYLAGEDAALRSESKG
ncbi:MAG TPA: DUF2247 family protein [Jatrophihabitantaceae bacterium]|nr:DUF2247 family protein [Jatrophihabitantaceae bacterium]